MLVPTLTLLALIHCASGGFHAQGKVQIYSKFHKVHFIADFGPTHKACTNLISQLETDPIHEVSDLIKDPCLAVIELLEIVAGEKTIRQRRRRDVGDALRESLGGAVKSTLDSTTNAIFGLQADATDIQRGISLEEHKLSIMARELQYMADGNFEMSHMMTMINKGVALLRHCEEKMAALTALLHSNKLGYGLLPAADALSIAQKANVPLQYLYKVQVSYYIDSKDKFKLHIIMQVPLIEAELSLHKYVPSPFMMASEHPTIFQPETDHIAVSANKIGEDYQLVHPNECQHWAEDLLICELNVEYKAIGDSCIAALFYNDHEATQNNCLVRPFNKNVQVNMNEDNVEIFAIVEVDYIWDCGADYNTEIGTLPAGLHQIPLRKSCKLRVNDAIYSLPYEIDEGTIIVTLPQDPDDMGKWINAQSHMQTKIVAHLNDLASSVGAFTTDISHLQVDKTLASIILTVIGLLIIAATVTVVIFLIKQKKNTEDIAT